MKSNEYLSSNRMYLSTGFRFNKKAAKQLIVAFTLRFNEKEKKKCSLRRCAFWPFAVHCCLLLNGFSFSMSYDKESP